MGTLKLIESGKYAHSPSLHVSKRLFMDITLKQRKLVRAESQFARNFLETTKSDINFDVLCWVQSKTFPNNSCINGSCIPLIFYCSIRLEFTCQLVIHRCLNYSCLLIFLSDLEIVKIYLQEKEKLQSSFRLNLFYGNFLSR